MRRVIVESPFAPCTPLPDRPCDCGHTTAEVRVIKWQRLAARVCPTCDAIYARTEEAALHQRYLAACLRDCVLRGETPYASHGLLTLPGVLRDDVPDERALGIKAGFAWRDVADGSVFYVDLGWSPGMRLGEKHASDLHDQHIREDRPTFHWTEARRLGGEWRRPDAEIDRSNANWAAPTPAVFDPTT